MASFFRLIILVYWWIIK